MFQFKLRGENVKKYISMEFPFFHRTHVLKKALHVRNNMFRIIMTVGCDYGDTHLRTGLPMRWIEEE